ncbi:MAG: Ig-like domain-containing protein [Clostridia bacterium]|nr:Ig-like domain-containing protein [Clostridia bacterium]
MSRILKKISSAAAVIFVIAAMTALFAVCASAAETWQVEDATNLRKSYSTSSAFYLTIPEGTKIKVTSKKTDNDYVWGKVTYGKHTGWCVLNFSKYKSGNLGVPSVTTTTKVFKGIVSLKWKSVPSAKKYTLKIYKSSGSLYKSYTVSSTGKTVSLPVGSYKATVTAKNPLTPSWSATDAAYSFSVASPLVQSIKISGSSSIVKGKTAALKATVSPSTAENKSVSWSSSNKKVLTVSSKGVVTAVAFGKATVICKAKDSSGVSAKYTVSVIPAACKAPVQSSATASSAAFKWSKVNGADGYQIYKYNSSKKEYVRLAQTTAAAYSINGLSAGSEVKVKVRAFKAVGKAALYGNFSPAVKLTALPAAPNGLIATGATKTTVSLKWNKVGSASKYAVYVYDSEKKTYTKNAVVTSNFCTLTCSAGNQVKVKIKSIKVIGEKSYYSAYSAPVTLYACPPAPSVKASVSGKKAVVSWSSVKGAARYEIQYSTSPSSGFRMFCVNNSAVRSCTATGLASDTYYFRVRAYVTNENTTYFGAWSKAVEVKI